MTKWLPKQFSLKTLMLATAALAVLLAVPRQRSLRQQYALVYTRAEVASCAPPERESLISRLLFGNREGDRIIWLVFHGVALTERQAALLTLFPSLRSVSLIECPKPKQTISALYMARNDLRCLGIEHTRLSVCDLQPVARFSNLEVLMLVRTGVSDEDLGPIRQLHQLRTLAILDAKVRGPGLVILQGLPSLQSIHLHHCPIDDQGLEYLSGIRTLRGLELWSTKVTCEGVERLQREFPECAIRFRP